MSRNEAYWPRAEEFLPERWTPEGQAKGLGPKDADAFLPFGLGSRSCLGRHFAQLEASIVAAVLLSQLDLAMGSGPEPQASQEMTMKVASPGLSLTVAPRAVSHA